MNKLDSLLDEISLIKKEIQELGDIHPGHLSCQYTICGVKGCQCQHPEKPKKHGPYNKAVYKLDGKSKSVFIQKHYETKIKEEILNYKKLRELIRKWATIGIELSKIQMKNSSPKSLKK